MSVEYGTPILLRTQRDPEDIVTNPQFGLFVLGRRPKGSSV